MKNSILKSNETTFIFSCGSTASFLRSRPVSYFLTRWHRAGPVSRSGRHNKAANVRAHGPRWTPTPWPTILMSGLSNPQSDLRPPKILLRLITFTPNKASSEVVGENWLVWLYFTFPWWSTESSSAGGENHSQDGFIQGDAERERRGSRRSPVQLEPLLVRDSALADLLRLKTSLPVKRLSEQAPLD